MTAKRPSMAEALSHAAGHAYSRPVSAEVQEEHSVASRDSVAMRPVLVPSRVGKKPVTGFFDPAVSKQIKVLGLNQGKTMQELLQEAFNDLFRKYDLPPIA